VIRTFKRVKKTRRTPIYNIGAASKLVGLPIWTLRWIERHDLVSPRRTAGNQRLFSDEDLERLDVIRGLMEEKVNLAGIRVILRLRGAPSSSSRGA
jgi:DNA-binding transcriptional MerR regulator